jgi:hypothetical protein
MNESMRVVVLTLGSADEVTNKYATIAKKMVIVPI